MDAMNSGNNVVQQISVLGARNEGEHSMVCNPTTLHGLSM